MWVVGRIFKLFYIGLNVIFLNEAEVRIIDLSDSLQYFEKLVVITDNYFLLTISVF